MPGKLFGDEFPLAWRHQFDGGRHGTPPSVTSASITLIPS